MWRLGLILLLLARIESLQCPEKCSCVQTSSSHGNSTNSTHQITCHELRDLPELLRKLPVPTTQLIVKQAIFPSLQIFHKVLAQVADMLPEVSDFSITDSVLLKQKDLAKEFLPFASISNPVARGSGFTKLQILNLSNNTLTFLPTAFFRSCSSLQTLDLSDNLIKNFETETFHPLINLLRLDLRRNRLKVLNEAIFRNLSKLLILDVSENEISRVAPTSFQYLVSLNTLILARNPLSANLVLLGAGRQLQIVDVSNTGLRQAPATLERTVRTLGLQGNLMTAIRCGDLDSYSLLSTLNLDNNHISYVEEDAMGRMELLEELHIAHNKLYQVPRSLPENLQLLDLSFNLIQNISKSDFLNLSSLKDLSLSNNQIHHIEESAFASLSSLKTLDLSRNPILMLPPLTGLTQLQVLNLSYLTNVSRAWRLSLRTFPVPSPGSVEELRLEASPALSLLFLTDTGTLQQFSNLTVLHLRFSNITTLRKDIFSLLPVLTILELEGNPWHCDQDMLVTAHWLKTHGAIGFEGGDSINTMHCATPSRLHGKPLIELSPNDFHEIIYEIEKLNTFQISKNESSLKKVQGNSSGLKSYENSIESVDNGVAKIEKTSNPLEGYRTLTEPKDFRDNDGLTEALNGSAIQSSDGEKNTADSRSHNSEHLLNISQEYTVHRSSMELNVSNITKEENYSSKISSGENRFSVNLLSKRGSNSSKTVKLKTSDSKLDFPTNEGVLKLVSTATVSTQSISQTRETTPSENSGNREENKGIPGEAKSSPHLGWDDILDVNQTDIHVNRTGADALSAPENPHSAHPGLLIMVFVGIIVVCGLALSAKQITRSRRDQGYILQDQGIEVRSINSASSELW